MQLLLHFYLLSKFSMTNNQPKVVFNWSITVRFVLRFVPNFGKPQRPLSLGPELVTSVSKNNGHSRTWSHDTYSQRSRDGLSLKSKSLIPAIKIRKLTSQTTILSPTTQEQHDLTILSQ